MLGAKNHARHFPEVPGNGRRNARRSMFGTKMLGAHVRCRGFSLEKKNKVKDIIQQYILQQNKTVYMKNPHFYKSPVFK